VLCRQGLQSFPDRMWALHHMRRVLRPTGGLALCVFTGPSPYFMALRDGVARYVSAESAITFAAAFWPGAAEELTGLLKRSAFHDVLVHQLRLTLRLPALDEFVLRHLSALPMAESVARVGSEVRAAPIGHVKEATRAYADGDGLAVPQKINVATGQV